MNPTVQTPADGTGPLYHRIYSIEFSASFEQALTAMRRLQCDPNTCSPQLLATFDKVRGSENGLKAGDEFYIHITGPWDGPVRVCDVREDSFRLITLRDHLEAGRITFTVKRLTEDRCSLEIESVARSKDWIVDLVFDKIPIARAAQTAMWTQFAEKFAREASGDGEIGDVQILTEKRIEETGRWEKV